MFEMNRYRKTLRTLPEWLSRFSFVIFWEGMEELVNVIAE